MSVGTNFTLRDQTALSDTSQVFEEPITLTGIESVELGEQFVVESSVVIRNSDRTQTFVEDLDYRLVTIGTQTSVERIATGNILDGETVLVDYSYRTGGTVEYESLSHSLSTRLHLSPRLSLLMALADSTTEVLGGEATTPLNDVRRADFKVEFNYPIRGGWSISGDAGFTRSDESITSFKRRNIRTSVRAPTFKATRINFGYSRTWVDYSGSTENVDRDAYLVGVQSRLPGNMYLRYSGNFSNDDGGTIFRKSKRHSLQLNWRYRQTTFYLTARVVDSQQGTYRQKDKSVDAVIARYFR